jgi:hypothetical protein
MNLERTLARLVIADVALAAAAIAADYVLEGLLPAPLRTYLAAGRTGEGGAADTALFALWAIVAAATAVAWVALVQYWRRGREMYLAATIAWVVYLLPAGPRVGSAPGHALGALEAMVAGALLALVYFSDLRKKY